MFANASLSRRIAVGALAMLGACAPASPGPDDSAIPLDMATGGGSDAPPASCSPACAGLTPKCNAKGHCVGCLGDMDCPAGDYCKIAGDTQATCVPGCTGDGNCGNGKKCCNNVCVDVGSDLANCGACGTQCKATHAAPTCTAGQCGFSGQCDPGWGDCNHDPKDGCEANLHTDANNCTACGMACNSANAINACADACYMAACQFGFADCNNDAMDGCETSVSSDPMNCGGCGVSCMGLPNAVASCQNAACVLGSCNDGFADCDHSAMNGCEVSTFNDSRNCGGCGNVCPQNLPNCVSGVCGTLPPSFAQWGGWQWFKVQVNGAMTDTNVYNACKNAGLTVPCQAANCPSYNDNLCKQPTPEMSCGNPMKGLSMGICNGQSPPGCPALNGVYQYMGHKWDGDSACGADGGWCADGKSNNNRWALCVAP